MAFCLVCEIHCSSLGPATSVPTKVTKLSWNSIYSSTFSVSFSALSPFESWTCHCKNSELYSIIHTI